MVAPLPDLPAQGQAPAWAPAPLSPELQTKSDQVLSHAYSASTLRGYQSDWRDFARWCARHELEALPATPETVVAYLADQADLLGEDGDRKFSPATLARRSAAITYVHHTNQLQSPSRAPEVERALSGIRRSFAEQGARPRRQQAPLRTADVLHLVATARKTAHTWPEQAAERRDSALLLMGFSGAFRRAELAGLQFFQVRWHNDDGLHVRLQRSKTDQEGRGHVKVLHYGATAARCPVCAYRRWLEVVCAYDHGGRSAVMRLLHHTTALTEHVCRGHGPEPANPMGPLFRPIHRLGQIGDTALAGSAVHAMVRRRAAAAGFSAAEVRELGAHSLRAGFVTEALSNGATAHEVMRQTGHASPQTVEIYAREHAPIENNAVTSLGL